MPDLSPIGPASLGPVPRDIRRDQAAMRTPAAPSARFADRVELSDRARYLARLNELPPVRPRVVDEIRQAIAEGTYLTDEKLDGAIERLFEDLAD